MERLRERMEIAEAEYQKELPKLIKHSVNALKLGGLFLALSLFLAILNGAKVAEVPAALVWLGFIIGSSCIVYGSSSFPKR